MLTAVSGVILWNALRAWRDVEGKLLGNGWGSRYVQRVRVVDSCGEVRNQLLNQRLRLRVYILNVDTCNHVDIIAASEESSTSRALIAGVGVRVRCRCRCNRYKRWLIAKSSWTPHGRDEACNVHLKLDVKLI